MCIKFSHVSDYGKANCTFHSILGLNSILSISEVSITPVIGLINIIQVHISSVVGDRGQKHLIDVGTNHSPQLTHSTQSEVPYHVV